MNLESLKVERVGHRIKLTPIDLHVLELLMRQTCRVVSKRELEKLLWEWEDEPLDGDAMRVHIHTLRSAIDKPFDCALIRTVHGTGARLAEPDGSDR